MQFQQLSESFSHMWSRISFSRLTLIYFLFSIVHCMIQVCFQIRAYTINVKAYGVLTDIVTEAKTFNNSLPILTDTHLHLCSWVPSSLDTDVSTCPIIWTDNSANPNFDSSAQTSNSADNQLGANYASPQQRTTIKPTQTEAPTPSGTARQIVTVLVIPQSTGSINGTAFGTTSGAKKRSDEGDDLSTIVTEQCLWALNWPRSILHNTKREDIVFIAFQFWVLAMSIVAVLSESIPHVIASLITHVMATAWGAFQISHTSNFRDDFNRVITEGACKGAPRLLPGFWDARAEAEIPSLVFNGLALIVSGVLTWKLGRLFGWQTFKRVGASLTINRIYKLVLSLSITIQLSLFFMAVTVGLWIDQLMNSVIGDRVMFLTLYKATSFATIALLLPWVVCGWLGARKELRLPMFVFLMLSILYMAGWGVMFFSTTFRWTFITWRFFSIMSAASVMLTLASVVLGIVCRFNFGKGLARYLNAQQPLADDVRQSYGGDIEKVAFPSSEKPLPTFYSYNGFESPYSAGPGSTLGPRFSNPDAPPFETSAGIIAYPQPAMKRMSNDSSIYDTDQYDKAPTLISFPSYHSRSDSTKSKKSQTSQTSSQKARWIIE
jgi:hypothetical protein